MKALVILIFSFISFSGCFAQQNPTSVYTHEISQIGDAPVIGLDIDGESATTQDHSSFIQNSIKRNTPYPPISTMRNTVNLRLVTKKKNGFDNRKQHMLKDTNGINVTFNVYMSYAKNFNPEKDTVYISGTFPDAVWNKPGTNPALRMSDPDSNMIYSITISFDSAQEVQYKYFFNAGWGGGEWQGGDNRIINISHDTTLHNIFGFINNDYVSVYPTNSDAWLIQSTGFLAQFRAIRYMFIVNPNVVWANAYDGLDPSASIQEFTKTTNGGKTWTPGKYTGVPSNSYISNITAISSQKAWIATYKKSATLGKNGIFVTNDGGNSWTQQTSAPFDNPKSFPDVVYFWDSRNGVCMGDPVNNYFEIYTTKNGGLNWIRVPSGNIPISLNGEYGYTNLYSVYGNIIWFGTNKGRVFKSTDNGYHWTVSSTGMTEVSNLGFHNENVGIATYVLYGHSSILDFQMKKSVDGGATWTTVSPSGVYYKTDIAVVPNAPGMLISTGRFPDFSQYGSAYSLDEGNTWTQLDDSIQYTTVKFYSSSVGWAGGFSENASSRGIWKWQGIPTTGVFMPTLDSMKIKIYPNPSSGIVHFHTSKNEPIIGISIYDMDGRLVSRLNKSQANKGKKDYVMDLRNLTKGTYVAVVQTKQGKSRLKLILQ